MNSNQAYALAKKIAEAAVSGVDSMSVDEQTLNIECNDGTHLEMDFPTPEDGVSIVDVKINNKSHLICTMSDGNTIDAGEMPTIPGGGTKGQALVKKSNKDGDVEWKDVQGGGGASALEDLTDVDIIEPTDGQILAYDAESGDWVNVDNEGGGDATLQSAVTSNLAVGAIASGTTLAKGTTFTEFAQKLLISEIAPTTTFSASGSGVKEVGTSVTPTLTLTITNAGTGTPTAIKFYDGSTLLDTQSYVSGTNTYTYTMDAVTTTKTVKGVLEYKKSDNTNGTVEKSATYTFVMASYYGAVATAPTDKAGIIALTKNVKNTKAQTATFTLSNQRSCYCYPASFGNLTSIKDANNFEYINSYTKTTVAVDGVDYNVYTLTDPVTATGFKQVYA